MMNLKKLHVIVLVAWLIPVFAGAPIAAETIQIQFSGLDFTYENGQIHDAQSVAGGSGDPADADSLATVSFFKNGLLVGTLPPDDPEINIFADILIDGVTGIPTEDAGMIHTGGSPGYFDLLTSPSSDGLRLSVDMFHVYYDNTEAVVMAYGTASGLTGQQLPFDLEIQEGEPVSIDFTGAVSNAQSSEGSLVSFDAIGTGSINASLVPEPSAVVLGLFGVVGFVVVWRRRKK